MKIRRTLSPDPDPAAGKEEDTEEQTTPQDAPKDHQKPNPPKEPATPDVMTHKVRLSDGREVTVGELVEYRRHAEVAMQQTDQLTAEQETSLRHVMLAHGYSPDNVNEYVNFLKEQYREEARNTDLNDPSRNVSPRKVPDELENRLEDRLGTIEDRVRTQNTQFLQRQLETSVKNALDTNPHIQTIIKKSVEFDPEGDKAKRLSQISEDIERATLALMKVRKARGEEFNVGWFDEESQRAASETAERYRAVIGDPDKIQRVPETDSGQDQLALLKEPETPKFESGKDDSSSAQAKARQYTEDMLLHLTGLEDKGDKTRA